MKADKWPRTHRCAQCGSPFPTRTQLEVHQYHSHELPEFKCSCKKKFKTMYSLRAHAGALGHPISTAFAIDTTELPFRVG
eukprot:7212468-Prorocentrum_lima.AAC.1